MIIRLLLFNYVVMELDYDGLLKAYNLRIEECMYKGKRIDELEEENKNLNDKIDLLEEEIIILKEKKGNLKEELEKYKKYYDRDKEELMESCYSLAKENDELKKEIQEWLNAVGNK